MRIQFPSIGNRGITPILAAIAMAVLAIAPPSARAATQYGAGSFTWDNGTTAKWSPTPGGPNYNTVWTSGNNAVFEGTAGTVTLASPTAHNLTFTTTGYTFSGASTLTLNGSAPTLWLSSGIAAATIGNNTATVLAGSAGLTKGGFGTVTLNGSAVHTVTGGLTINPGGTLTLDLRNLTPATDLINNGNVLTLAGGELNLTGKGSAVTSQSFASTTLNNGGSTVTLNRNSATSLTGALGAITRNAGGTLLISTVPNTSTTIATTTTGNEGSGILAPWAAVGATTAMQYAANNGSGQIISYAGATTTASPANLSDVSSASVNYAFGATASPTLTGAITANTLRFTGAAGVLTTVGNNITLNSLMNAGSGSLDIGVSGGTNGNLVVGANKELVFWTGGQAINIYSPIVDNSGGASSVVFGGNNPPQSTLNANVFKYTGSTTVNLGYGGTSGRLKVVGASGTWSYTGDMTINGGTVWLQGSAFAGGGSFTVGNMTVNAGGTIMGDRGNYVAKTGCALTLNGGTWSETNGFGGSWTGPVYLTADSTIDSGFQQTVTGVIGGSFGFTKMSSGTLILNSNNTYAGNTIISAGVLQLGNALALQNSNLDTTNSIASSSTSTGLKTGSGVTTLTFGGLSGNKDLSTLFNAANGYTTVTALTLNPGTGATPSYSGIIANGATGMTLTKTGAGTQTLTGAHTYTGATNVNVGTLLVNGSLRASSAVTVNSGGTLGGLGTLSGTLTVNGSGTVALGSSGGTFSLASATAPTFVADSTLKIAASTPTLDKLSLTNATPTFACGILNLVVDTTGLASAFSNVEIVHTANAAGVTGNFANVTVTGDTSYYAIVSYGSNSITLSLTKDLTAPGAYRIQSAGSSTATFNAGGNAALTITALNLAGNILATLNSDVTLSFYGLAASPNNSTPVVNDKTGVSRAVTTTVGTPNTTLTFVNGVATVSGSNNGLLTAYKGGTATLHCSDGTATSAGGPGAAGLSVTINPLALASYNVATSSSQVTGVTFPTTVTALDTYGNTVTTDSSTVVTLTSSGSVQFDSNGDSTFGDNTKTLGSGTFTINTRDNAVESVTLTATSSGGKTGTSSTILISANTAKDIVAFTFPTYGAATISGTTITKTVPFGTVVTNLAPTYTVSTGANGNPVSGTALDFTNPRTYTITAADTSTKTYTVTVTVAPQPTVFTWASAANGNWSTAANWTNNLSDGTAPLATGYANYTLNFTPSGTYTVTNDLNNGFLLNQANFAGAVTLAGTNGITFTNNGATLPAINQNSGSAIAISAPVSLAANTTLSGTGNGTVTINSAVSGAGGLTKSNSGQLTLMNANTYTGGTVITAGTLSVRADLGATLGATGSQNLTLQSGGTLSGERANFTGTLLFNGGTWYENNGFGGSWTGPVTVNATSTISSSFAQSIIGVVSGSGGLIHTGSGTLVVSSNNTFTGAVAINGGSLNVSSLNSISGGTASSSLGAPTTVAAGTIAIGTGSTGGTLTYTGNGETTDRVIKLAGTIGGATITQSGNANLTATRGQIGLLKFTSNLSIPGTASTDNRKTLTLTSAANISIGSTPGQGEISGSIGDSQLGNSGQTATSIVKAGNVTWSLSGANSYSGSTQVQAGTLAFSQAASLGGGSLDITSGAVVRLNYIGTRQISALTFNAGSALPNGTYGSSASPATNKNDTYFSGPGTVTVGPLSSSPTVALALGSGGNPSSGGAPVTFTATVTGNLPTGYVLFYDGTSQLGAGTLNASHQATITTSLLTGGSHPIIAVYPGDSNNGVAYSTALTQTVTDTRTATTTSLALTAGGNPSAFGAPVTFTATVTASAPSGSVAFYDGATLLGTATVNGYAQAALTTSGLAVGYRAITASYLGDAANAPSTTSSTLFQTVSPPPGNGKWKVFILAGQSNMQGKASVESGRDPNNYSGSIAGGLGSLRNMLNKNVSRYGYLADPANPVGGNPGWITRSDVSVTYWSDAAGNQVNGENRRGNLDPYFGDVGQGTVMGPEYAFGLVVGSQLADQVLLIKYAFGGKSLAVDFRPPSSGGTVGPYYTGMLSRVNQVLGNLSTFFPGYIGGGYEISGFAWHQGWNDIGETTLEYETNLTNLIKDLRTDLGVPNLPVSIGNTGMANGAGGNVLVAQMNVGNPALHPEFAGTVTTVDTRPFDFGNAAGASDEGYHWNRNAESYFNVGEKMGQAMMNLLGSQSSAKDILAFAVPGQTAATISANTIAITVSAGTDVTSLVPTFTVSPLATATPVTGAARNFTAPQTYTVTAQNLTTKTYTVTVSVSSSPYSDWASNPALGLTPGVNDGPLDDPDHDGIQNLLEFVLGGLPMTSSRSIMPTFKNGSGPWLFEYYRNRASLPPATTQVVQYSNDMTNWNEITVPASSSGAVTVTPGSSFDHVAVTIPAANSQTFVRLKVSQ